MKRAFTISALFLGTWVGSTGCIQMQEPECDGDEDCLGDRVCQDSECVMPEGARAGDGSGGSKEGAGGSNGSGGSSEAGTSGSSTTGPSCTDLRSGTQTATAFESTLCNPEVGSVSVTIGSSGLLQSVDGRSCTLTQPGSSCYSVFPDKYDCGGCGFSVGSETTNGSDVVGWTLSATCADAACSSYCCVTEANVVFAADYWLEQASSSGAGGSSGASGGVGGSSPRDPCAGCGYPFCDGNCAGCC